MKKSKEISLTRLDQTLAPEDFGLEDREHSSIFDPKAERHQSKTLRNCYEINEQEKKRENTVHEFEKLNNELLYHSCFQQLEEWEENVRCLLKNFVNLFL